MRKIIRIGIQLCGLVLFALALGACSKQQAKPPNLLLVVLDTTRADVVQGYGANDSHTPFLREISRTGVLFENARSTSAWTVPSHGSLFTGLYPSRHGAHWESGGLDPSRPTLAQVLSSSHQTAGFCENPHIIKEKGYAAGFESYEDMWREQSGWDIPPQTEQSVSAWYEKRDRSRPFFLFVNFMTPHLPYTPPEEHQARYVPRGFDSEAVAQYRQVGDEQARRYMMGEIDFKPHEFSMLRALYRAEVSYADARVGKLLELLQEDDELDNTLIIVVSDHGENIGDHQLMEHQLCLYESLLRVPMIMRLPSVLTGGRRVSGPVQLVDVMPTALDALQVPRESWPKMEGMSLVAEEPSPERPSYAEYMRPLWQKSLFLKLNPQFDFSPYERRLKSIQIGNKKLILSEFGQRELYDLEADPMETQDLAAERPEEADRLQAALLEWAKGGASHVTPEADVDEETRKALEELGYIEQ